MKLVRNIMAAIDVRSQSEAVLHTVAMLAKKFGSQVTLMHVLPVEDAITSDLRELVELARGEAIRCLERSAAKLQQMGIAAPTIVVAEGNVAEQIVRLSDERDANVVIMGCGNESGAAHSLGRNAEAVTRLAEKPVWVVKTSEGAAPNSILCAVDYTISSRRALKNAVHVARAFGSELTVMRAVASPGFSLLPFARQETALEESQRVAEEQRLVNYVGEFDLNNVRWRPVVCSGESSAAILATARTVNPQLVIAGTDYVAGWMQMLQGDSITYLARHLPCSLIVIKADDAVRLEMDRQLADAQTHYERGCDLMAHGFSREAVEEFQHCVRGNTFFIPAWLGLADAYRRLGDPARAEEYENGAKDLRNRLAWDQVVADVRRHHPLWQKS